MKIYTGVPGDSWASKAAERGRQRGICRAAEGQSTESASVFVLHLPCSIGFMRIFGYHIWQFLRDLSVLMQCALYACGISRKKYHCKSAFVKQGGAEHRTGPKNRG